jgi:hypothetical protein
LGHGGLLLLVLSCGLGGGVVLALVIVFQWQFPYRFAAFVIEVGIVSGVGLRLFEEPVGWEGRREGIVGCS